MSPLSPWGVGPWHRLDRVALLHVRRDLPPAREQRHDDQRHAEGTDEQSTTRAAVTCFLVKKKNENEREFGGNVIRWSPIFRTTSMTTSIHDILDSFTTLCRLRPYALEQFGK